MPTGPDPAVAFAFVDDLAAPALGDAEQHHLERVRRLRTGAPLTVGDGAGSFRSVTFGPALTVVGPIESVPLRTPTTTVGFALTKGDKPELVVQKLTELGVDRILPLAAARSVVRWDGERATRGVARLRQVAREAAMQSRRSRLPTLEDLATVADAATALAGIAGLCEQDGAEAPTLRRPTLLVGPEGGWDEAERSCGLPLVGVGHTTLRADTAALAAGVLLTALRSATVREGFR